MTAGSFGAQQRLHLASAIDSPAAARKLVRDALTEWELDELTTNAQLVVSELVTNAVLHAQTDIDVVLTREPDGLRVEVQDGAADVVMAPVTVPEQRGRSLLDNDHDLDTIENLLTGAATTGRGLRLVDGVATSWGVEPRHGGKVVWATLHVDERRETASAAVAGTDEPSGEGQPVRLVAVPTRLALESDLQLDTLVREFQVMAAGAHHGQEAAPLVDAAREIVQRYASPRRAGQRALRAAVANGDRLVDADLVVPQAAVPALHRLTELLDEVAAYCNSGALLALAPSEELRAFRRWYTDEVERQLGGRAPRACPFPVVPPGTAVADLAPVDLGPRAQVAVDRLAAALATTGEIRGVTRLLLAEAVDALGASHASVCLVADNEHVDIVDSVGYPKDVTGHWSRFAVSADLPASEAIRLGRSIVMRTRAERDTRYPAFRGTPVLEDPAFACVPFVTGAPPARGCLVVNFAQSRAFSAHDLRVLQEMCARTADALARIDRVTLAE